MPKDVLLLAVSGGADSVVLCELTRLAGFQFIIAHCNFQLRGEESNRDEEFVQKLGERYGKEVVVKRFDTENFARLEKVSVQVAARELRYNWFREMVRSGQPEENSQNAVADYIVTAHHADDNIETMLMNFFKGTGIAGLRGILPKQRSIVRPLLFARKAALLQFAGEHQLSYVEDSSNAGDKYSRNYFRHRLIPVVQKVFHQAEENMLDNLKRFRDVEQLYRQAVNRHKDKLLEMKGSEIHIPVLKWKKASPLETITYEIIKEYGFTPHQTGQVIALMDSISGSYIQSGHFRIIKNWNWMIISPLDISEQATIVIEENDSTVNFSAGRLDIKRMPAGSAIPDSAQIAQLDADMIRFPLLLRKQKRGDYFYPLGMQKKKKLGRFLSDAKASLTDKENTWVLEMNKKIIWIVGKRIDDRFKITSGTTTVLQITIGSSQSAVYG